MQEEVLSWLLEGDVSIQYQVHRDLLGQERKELQDRIAQEGWGARFLAARHPEGHWGRGFYQPKWTSSHYTLLDLRNLRISPDNRVIKESIEQIAQREKAEDGGINPAKTISKSDACVNGMFLNYACYFRTPAELLQSIVDFILFQKMPDGGFNCRKNRSGARHSSLHSTINIIEGILEYRRNGYTYRLDELEKTASESRDFILRHRFFRSDHTGEIIHKDFLKLSYPERWRYNILRALDYFRASGMPWDERMEDALEVLRQKRRKDARWNGQAKYPGQVHFQMEKAGKPSRWISLQALRVLKTYS